MRLTILALLFCFFFTICVTATMFACDEASIGNWAGTGVFVFLDILSFLFLVKVVFSASDSGERL